MNTLEAIAKRVSVRNYKPEQITEEELRAILKAGCAAPIASAQYETLHITVVQDAVLRKKVYEHQKAYVLQKLDILQELLEDDQITEIMINGTEHIFIEKEGGLYQLQKRFADRLKLEDVIQQIVAGANRMVNEASPIVDARLSDGSRVNVVLYPIALNGPIVTIRKFSREAMTMKELVRRESMSQEIDRFLEELVASKYNIFISGGTGSG